MKQLRKNKVVLGSLVALALALGVLAQTQYPMDRGNAARTGVQNELNESPGRMLLRWFDPPKSITFDIDNWEATAIASPAPRWIVPSGDRLAADAVEKNKQTGRPPYLYASLERSGTEDWIPQNPANLASFQWDFTTTLNQEFALYVNLPSGPTADASGNLFYPQQFFVYEITGVVNADNPGQPVHDVVDTYLTGGGEARIGNGGRDTSRVFKATGTRVSIRLLNTISRDSQGDLTESRANAVVYADSAKLVRTIAEAGEIIANPVVAQYDGLGSTGQRRVFTSRNESTFAQVLGEVRSYNLAITSSYVHNGTKVDLAEPGIGGDVRRNVEWSWPVQRPLEDTEQARLDFAAAKVNWIVNGPNRADQNIPVDNQSAGTSKTLGWTVVTSGATKSGPDFLTAPIGAGSESVTFRPSYTPDGSYGIQVWSPGPNAGYAAAANVEIRRAGFLIATIPVNFQQANFVGPDRWITLRANNISAWDSSGISPLSVVITNTSALATDVGTVVPADAVRFVRQADLSVTATPAVGRVAIAGSPRNVLYVPMENGRIYALQTNATPSAVTTPTLLWTYPSENLAGKEEVNGIAEAPVGFGRSSPLFATVGGQPRLYVGSKNGRVYCLNALTGDRIWSWPSDYPSASPANYSAGGRINPIEGGVTLARVRQGGTDVPAIAVPTTNGRLYLLDAAGNAADKSTTTLLQYPRAGDPDLGAVRMTPAADVYADSNPGTPGSALGVGFGGQFFWFDLVDSGTGTPVVQWQTDGANVPLAVPAFGGFGTASPVVVNAAIEAKVSGVGPLFYIPGQSGVYALNTSNGSLRWFTSEAIPSDTGSLGFTIANGFNRSGVRDYDPLTGLGPNITPTAGPGRPMILVPTGGGLARLNARTADDNRNNVATDPERYLRSAGGYQGAGTRSTAVAFSGIGVGLNTLAALGDARYDDDYGYMYFADNAGFLYAFGDDPDLPNDGQIVTPGDPPINVDPGNPNDPAVADLVTIANNARVTLITPAKYREIQKLIGTGNLTTAQLSPYLKNTSEAAAILRKSFDYGETLYVLVYNLPDLFIANGSSSSYRLTATFNPPGGTGTARNVFLKALTTGAQAVGIAEIQLQPSGQNGSPPGKGSLAVSVFAATTRANRSANQPVPAPNYVIGPFAATFRSQITLANPLALAMPTGVHVGTNVGVGQSVNPNDAENSINGSPLIFSNPAAPTANYLGVVRDSQFVGTGPLEAVTHGATAYSRLQVIDRSALVLIRGNGVGLNQVRFRPSDMGYPAQPDVYKRLDPTDYRNFEQLPSASTTNNSLDYPNLRRDQLVVRKSVTGAAQNPIFSGVSLVPPSNVVETNYDRDIAAYDAGLPRTLRSTEFRVEIDIPKFQPPAFTTTGAQGYFAEQFIYVDANTNLPPVFDANSNFAYRSYTQSANVAVDEALSVGTKTVDIGAMPGGALYVAGLAPKADAALFTRGFAIPGETFYKDFSVLNEGNVNLLNVRTSKGYSPRAGTTDVLRLFAGSVNGATAMNGAEHLHTDLDPVMSSSRPEQKRILQKARVGDSEPTRLRLTPVARANPNLGVGDPGLLDLQDPRVALSVPFGTPSGDYLNQIRVFEDTDNVSVAAPVIKRLSNGVDEAFSNPGFDLRFRVRETRLTTSPTRRTRPMIDTGAATTRNFNWNNVQPSVIRDQTGTMFVAWSSNRRDAANAFGFDPRQAALADTEQDYGTTIYVARLGGGTPTSQSNDVEAWDNSNNARWFSPATTTYPNETLFPPRSGYTYVPGSVRFENPTFSSSGISDPFGFGVVAQTYMVFTGSAVRTEDNVREYRLFLTPVNFRAGNMTWNLADVRPLGFGTEPVTSSGRIGKPSVVVMPFAGRGTTALIFYPETSGGLTQIMWASYNSRDGWVAAGQATRGGYGGNRSTINGSLGLSSSFESVSSVSAAARTSATRGPVVQLSFTGKLRGRLNADTYLSTIQIDPRTMLPRPDVSTRTPIIAWERRDDVLDWDPVSEAFWSIGAELVGDQNEIFGTDIRNRLDILVVRNGVEESILVDAERTYDSSARLLRARTIYGGYAVVDLANGSVRFSGSIIPRNVRMTIRYVPRYVRVNGGTVSNCRSVAMVIDDRYQTETNYLGSEAYQFNNTYGEYTGRSSPGQFTRMWIAYAKTATTGGETSRIHYRTFRQGAQLPLKPALDDSGRIISFRVSGMVGGTNPVSQAHYQVDPVNGLIFVNKENEGRTITVTYLAVRPDGTTTNLTAPLAIGWAGEGGESTMPTDQGVNEGAIALSIDPLSTDFRRQDRPGLIWMVWVSTRQGQPDLFMQTIAPRISPVPGN